MSYQLSNTTHYTTFISLSTKHLAMCKVSTDIGGIKYLYHVCPPVRKIIHSLKLVDYLHVQAINPWYNYTQQRKKRTTTIFPFRSPFETKFVNCHKIFISDQILLKLKCDVDEYLYLPCTGTKLTKANGKRVAEALIQCFYLH